MKRLRFCLAIALLGDGMVATTICAAQTPPVRWAKQAVSTNSISPEGLAMDRFGNTFVAGYVDGNAAFDTLTLNATGGFVAKYDSFGNALWAVQAGAANGSGYNTGIATDAAGNAYVIGTWLRTARFGEIILTNSNSDSGFVTKIDASGNFLWAKPLTASFSLHPYGVATDNAGNCFVTGMYGGDADFGTNLPNGAGFVAEFDSSGNLLWAAPAGGGGAAGVALDRVGNVLVTGGFSGTAVWGNGASRTNLTGNAVGGNMFLAKYDNAGNLIWVSSGTNAFSFSGEGVPLAIGGDGSTYVTGRQYPLTTSFVCKYSSTGNLVWLKFAPNVRANSIALDSTDNAYVTGGYDGGASFSGTPFDLVSGNQDVFLAKYDSAGNLVSLNGFGGPQAAYGVGITVSTNGQNIYLTGWMNPGATFGDFTLTTGTQNGGFFLSQLSVQTSAPNLSLDFDSVQIPAVRVQGFVGRTYQLEYKDSLQENWQPWVRFVLPSSPYTLFDPSPNPTNRFYRAGLVQP